MKLLNTIPVLTLMIGAFVAGSIIRLDNPVLATPKSSFGSEEKTYTVCQTCGEVFVGQAGRPGFKTHGWLSGVKYLEQASPRANHKYISHFVRKRREFFHGKSPSVPNDYGIQKDSLDFIKTYSTYHERMGQSSAADREAWYQRCCTGTKKCSKTKEYLN